MSEEQLPDRAPTEELRRLSGAADTYTVLKPQEYCPAYYDAASGHVTLPVAVDSDAGLVGEQERLSRPPALLTDADPAMSDLADVPSAVKDGTIRQEPCYTDSVALQRDMDSISRLDGVVSVAVLRGSEIAIQARSQTPELQSAVGVLTEPSAVTIQLVGDEVGDLQTLSGGTLAAKDRFSDESPYYGGAQILASDRGQVPGSGVAVRSFAGVVRR